MPSPYVPLPWKDGDRRRWVMAVCCPSCGGSVLGVGATHGKHVRYMKCKTCGRTWREVVDDFCAKAWAVS